MSVKDFINKTMSHFEWWRKWFGPGTDDDWRNPFWRWTEAHRIKPVCSHYLFNLRLGFKRKSDGKWTSDLTFWKPTDQNFWNGIFTFNIYVTKSEKGWWWPRFNWVIRFCAMYWFAFGVGILHDRGEFGWTGPHIASFKDQVEHNPDVIAHAWDEGGV